MDGELRWPCRSSRGPPSCTARSLAAECPASAAWQETQACLPEADSEVSLKIFSPRPACAESVASCGAVDAGAVPPPPHAATTAARLASIHPDTLVIAFPSSRSVY